MEEHLFVYGSLRQGLWGYQRYLTDYSPLGTRRIPGFEMYTIRGQGYPFIRHGEGEITGEIFKIPSSKVAELDIFEDCPTQYTRSKVVVDDIECWIYVYTKQDFQVEGNLVKVEGGDWVNYNEA